MYAIIEDSGTQIKVASGDILDIDLRDKPDSDTLTFDKVLAVGDGESAATLGTPYINGASVTAAVLDEVRGDKIDVIKYKRRKGYRRKAGHRQKFLRVKITDIKS